MSGHIYKNFFIMKPAVIFIGVLQLISSAICILVTVFTVAGPRVTEEDISFIPVVCIMCYFMVFYTVGFSCMELFKQDERPIWVGFAATTPSSSRGQVLSKYLCLLIVYAAVGLCCFLNDVAVMAIITLGTNGEFLTNSMVAIVEIFAIELFFTAVETPFIIRFGTNKGVAIKGAAIGVVLLIVIVYFLFGDISFLVEGDKEPMEAIKEWLGSSGPIAVFAVIPYVSAAAYFISYKISHKIYRKGAEGYGQ